MKSSCLQQGIVIDDFESKDYHFDPWGAKEGAAPHSGRHFLGSRAFEISRLERRNIRGNHYEQRQIEIEADQQRFNEEYEAIEQQNSNLANLYVASYRLHGTLDRDEVLPTVLEILINLVGTEEVGVFELDLDQSALKLAASHGIDEQRHGARSFCFRTAPLRSESRKR